MVPKMEVDGIVNSDWSLNNMCGVSLIFDLQVLALYFKKESRYSDRFAIGQNRGNFF